MNKDEGPKRFDLEERTFGFAKRLREFVKGLSKTIATSKIRDSSFGLLVLLAPITSKRTNHSAKKTLFCGSRFAGRKQKKVDTGCD
jgi:hypothetical protein